MAKKKREPKARPFPEAIDGRPWKIQESPTPRQAGVGDGRMLVPFGTEMRERAVRLHEMMHVKITPALAIQEAAAEHELPEDILQNCEDARVHGHLRRLGFGEEMTAMEGVISDFEIDQMAKRGELLQVAALGAAMYGTGEFKRLQEAIKDDTDKHYAFHTGKDLSEHAMHGGKKIPEFEQSVWMCQKLVELFGNPERPEEPSVKDVLQPKRVYKLAHEMLEKGTPEKIKVEKVKPEKIKGGNEDPHADGKTWMKMEIITPDLTHELPKSMREKPRKIPEASGRRLRRVGRLYHDGRVFSRKLRKPGGGAVLIDVSGSMSLSGSDVLKLVQKFPGGVIATYCSEAHNVGWLTVIARNGKRCEEREMHPRGGGNGVDGPALDWIAKHPGPRFWISDAGVYGGAEGLAYCVRVCTRFNIKRVDNAHEILDQV